MGKPRHCSPTPPPRSSELTAAPRTHRCPPLLSCPFPSARVPVPPRSGALLPGLPVPPHRSAERPRRRPAARPPSPLLEAPSASPAPPGFCSAETGPRPISAPRGRPHNLPCCSARCLAPFGTSGARNSSEATYPPQPLGLCLHLQIPDGYRRQGTGACPGLRRGHPNKPGHAGH